MKDLYENAEILRLLKEKRTIQEITDFVNDRDGGDMSRQNMEHYIKKRFKKKTTWTCKSK